MMFKTPSKLIFTAIVALATLVHPTHVQAFTIISYTAQGSATDVPFSGRIDNALDNYSEMAGIYLSDAFTLENVQQIGFSMCRNGAGSANFFARLLDASDNIIATSTTVAETSLPSCTGYASTTATSTQYAYFDFANAFDWDQGESIIVTQGHAETPNSEMWGTTTTSVLIFQSKNCYGVNGTDKIGGCLEGFFSTPYFIINDSSGVNVDTRIVDVYNPLNGSLQPSTNVNFRFDYYFNDTVDILNYDYVSTELTDLSTGQTIILPKQYIALSGLDTYDFTSTLVEGDYYMWRPFMHSIGTSTSNIYGSNRTFDVVTYSGETSPYTQPNSTTTEMTLECGDTLIAGSICNVLGYLFVPPPTTLDKYANLWQIIKTKRPFGYVTKTIEQLQALDVSGSSAFTLGTVPFMDSIFSPLRTLIGGILWGLFAIYFYQRRLIHLDI